MADRNSPDENKEPTEVAAHTPLPYIVRLRVMESDDMPPVVRVFNIMAYSVFEAMIQASMEALGTGTGSDDERVKVERIGPDLQAYERMYGRRISSRVLDEYQRAF